MAKKKTQVKKNAKAQRPRRPNGPIPRGLRLSESELDYAKLVSDPCHGPLVPGLFGDGNGSVVGRFEADYSLLVGATDTAGAFAFLPSRVGFWQKNAADDQTALNWNSSYAAPGSAFIGTKGRYRCLAACMQIYYNGAEQDRKGFVGVACVDGSVINDTTTTAARLRTSCGTVVRMPPDMIEVKWRPTDDDTQWCTSGFVESANVYGKHNALIATVSGIPVNTGVRVRLVAVYEYQDRVGNGTTMVNSYPNHDTKALAPFDWHRALTWLDNKGAWMVTHGVAAAKQAYALAAAVL